MRILNFKQIEGIYYFFLSPINHKCVGSKEEKRTFLLLELPKEKDSRASKLTSFDMSQNIESQVVIMMVGHV